MAGRGGDPGRAPTPRHVVAYIIRRLIAAVGAAGRGQHRHVRDLLPGARGWPARRRRRWRRATSAGPPTAETVHADRRAARASTTRCYVQYGDWVKGIVVGGRLRHRRRASSTARRRASGYSFITQQPVLARPARPAAGHALAGGRRGGDLAGRRRRDRRALGAATRQRLRPGRDERRAGRRLAADLLHRPARRWRSSATSWAGPAPAAATRRSSRTRAQWAYDLHPAVDHAGASCSPRSTPGSPAPACWRRWARTTSAPPGPRACRSARVVVKHGLRGRADPDRHHLRPRPRPAARRRRAHRDARSRCPGSASTPSTAIVNNDLPQGARRDPGRRLLRRPGQPGRRPALRRRRPEGEDCDDRSTRRTSRRPAAAPAPAAFLEVRDLRVHFPTDDGLVKAVDGLSLRRSSAARPSASSASPAPASA